jgi:hypothetical protein
MRPWELPQGQMKINKDTINFFKSLYWDYQVSEENRWYEIKKILSPELLKEALSEDVLKTLFPKSLCLKYKGGIHLEQVAFLTERQYPLPDIPAQA